VVSVHTLQNEDDTFRKLKRPSYGDMKDIWASSELYDRGKWTRKELDVFFESYGWSYDEYADVYHKANYR